MPVYNDEAYLTESIQSILNQTYRNFEFIIINDGSTDKSDLIISSYQKSDNRIKYLKYEKQGVTKSLNVGIDMSQGEYIARMDSDDIAEKERFNDQLQFLDKNKNIDIVGSQISFIDSQSQGYSHKVELPINDILIKWDLIFGTPLFHPALMIRKNVFEQYGNFNPKLIYAQDLEFWRKIARNVKFSNLQNTLMKIRKPNNLPDINKITIQSNIRFKSLILYLKNICGIDYDFSMNHQISRFLISGEPKISNFPQFLEIIMNIKTGFIKNNCSTYRESFLINKRVSLIILRSISMNTYPIKTYFMSAKSLLTIFPVLIMNTSFWKHLFSGKLNIAKV